MPFTFKPILNDKPKADGTYLVLLRITKDRKCAKVSLGVFVRKADWNPKAKNEKYVRPSCDLHGVYNESVSEKLKEARTLASVGFHTLATLRDALRGNSPPTLPGESFTGFFTQYIARKKLSFAARTVEKYENILAKLTRFTAGKEILFSDLTVGFVRDFEAHLLTHNKANTIQKTMQFINAVVNRAIEVEKMDPHKNPFLRLKFKKERTDKARLSEEEIKRLEALSLPADRQIFHVRNLFLMQYYCSGVRIGDMLQVKWRNIVLGRLFYRTDKNNRNISVKLQAGALRILAHYAAVNENHFIFPFLDNGKDYSNRDFLNAQLESKTTMVNKQLRRLEKLAGIDKHLSSHVSRHSFADMARKKTGDIYAISKALGHSSIGVTESYLSSFDEDSVDKTMDDLFRE